LSTIKLINTTLTDIFYIYVLRSLQSSGSKYLGTIPLWYEISVIPFITHAIGCQTN